MDSSDISALNNYSNSEARVNLLYFADKFESELSNSFQNSEFSLTKTDSILNLLQATYKLSINDLNTVILIEVNPSKFIEAQDYIHTLKNNFITKNLITIFLLTEKSPDTVKKAIGLGVSDCYTTPIPFKDVKERLKFLTFYKVLRSQVNQLSQVSQVEYRTPIAKRFLDLILSSIALLCLSPIFLIVAALIKMDSKGPVFYSSKRVGTGYKIFDFYKFRSMRIGADAEVESLASQNQYGNSTFFKIQNDPRITKLGSFLRSSSIDELPQLLNVIKGDMSLVGNRPLPLYEAEQLTTNEWSMRFLGPAGLTGLWQISKRGKKDMSDVERKKLDNFYAKHYSIWLDIKIIFKTIPALLQKEKV
ncbi:MAG: sugar transferase [Bacteroidetes bacterium]|nr:sugar transferase [Bacteroidota bacterium]MBU1484047.1 sugar transferase [Bacteroidota bacterium]MBU2045157.1 sugar transferase [Bacteroidota bacterium]MBU2267077.1 sugar transferase [Bacteroidota bacterium]MBU2374990.1 sugar transferase [Bacteroidota bacterium]